MLNSSAVVYGLSCSCHEDGIRYVGKTSVGVKQRMYGHKSESIKFPDWPKSRWIRKHGFCNIIYTVIESTDDSSIDDREIFWIERYRNSGLADLNISSGGGGLTGWNPSLEIRQRMSDSQRARYGKQPIAYVPKVRKSKGKKQQCEAVEEVSGRCSLTWQAKGLCNKHYRRMSQTGTTEPPGIKVFRNSLGQFERVR